jgi:lysophospholipase L1-like esterase
MKRASSLLLLGALVAACGPVADGDDNPSQSATDSGASNPAPRDAGGRPDAQPNPEPALDPDPTPGPETGADAGLNPTDAGKPSDAGPQADSGPRPSDAGQSPDAGASTDAGGEAFLPCPTTGACKIMPLGDSITDGVGSSGGGGYRIELFRQSGTDKKAITFVGSSANGPSTVDGRAFPKNHEGHSGYTIDQINQLIKKALTTHQPHIVLLMIGTNDMNLSADLANAPKRLGNLLDSITTTSPNALVVVAKIIPFGNSSSNGKVQTYNDGIPPVVNQRISAGKHLILVDMYKPFTDNPKYSSELLGDGVHPTSKGYAVMANVWYPVIKPLLPAAQ